MTAKRIAIFLIVACGLLSCSRDKECRVTNTIRLQIAFYADSLNAEADTVMYAVSIDSLTFGGVGMDSLLYDNKKNVSSVSVPLNKNAESVRYAMLINGVADTLQVDYQNTDWFISLECGCFTYHTLTDAKATTGAVKSVLIVNEDIGIVEQENIYLILNTTDFSDSE